MARVIWLELDGFRNWKEATFSPSSQGITAIVGDNGHGKTNLIEAVFYVTTGGSFRSFQKDVLINQSLESTVLRATVHSRDREISLDCSINRSARDRHLLNKKQISKMSDLRNEVPVIEFNPEDLQIIKGSPSNRRGLLDDFLSMTSKAAGRLIEDTEKVLRQRAALLKSAYHSPEEEIGWSLDVWDEKLALFGTDLVQQREALIRDLQPICQELYALLSGDKGLLELTYSRSWKDDLLLALHSSRQEDLRRQVTLVGPHRDELVITLGGMPARMCASQGEQRTIAYVLKAAMCRLLGSLIGESPVVLLDDVLSELDSGRARSLLEIMPAGQVILTATAIPDSVDGVSQLLRIRDGAFT